MASLNTLRTRYGIVLSIVIALVLVAFILGDQLSMRGGNEATDQVELIVNGKEIRSQEFYEAQQAVGGNYEAAKAYLIYQHYLGAAIKGLGIAPIDELTLKTEIASGLLAQGLTDEQINQELNMVGHIDLLQRRMQEADQIATQVINEGFYLNTADLEVLAAQNNLSYSGRYVRYPYSTVADADVTVTDEEVRAYYDAHPLRNTERGTRTLVSVEFLDNVAPATIELAEGVEGAEVTEATEIVMDETISVEDRVTLFVDAAGNDVETFTKAADEAGLFVSEMADMDMRSYEIISWARNNPVGAINRFVVDNKSVVVMVKAIDENEFVPFEDREQDIRTRLMNDKKYEIIAPTMTLAESAEKFEKISFNDASYDAHLVGAICATAENTETKVKGEDAAYIFIIDSREGELGDVKAETNSYRDGALGETYKSLTSYAFSEGLDVVDPRME